MATAAARLNYRWRCPHLFKTRTARLAVGSLMMCVYLFKSLRGRSRSPKAGSSGMKEGGRCVLYWQRNPVSLLQVEAEANSTNSGTQRSHIREKIETTQKEK